MAETLPPFSHLGEGPRFEIGVQDRFKVWFVMADCNEVCKQFSLHVGLPRQYGFLAALYRYAIFLLRGRRCRGWLQVEFSVLGVGTLHG